MPHDFVWSHCNRPELGLLDRISSALHAHEWITPGGFTDIRTGNQLIIASDYSGEQSNSNYQAISFIILDHLYIWLWYEMRQKLRSKFLKNRRISFKSLSDKKKATYLPCFLNAADHIVGNLFVFLIDKRIEYLYDKNIYANYYRSNLTVKRWKRKPFEKLVRVLSLLGLIINGLSKKHQDVIWITDNDNILPSENYNNEFKNIVSTVNSNILDHNMGHFRFSTTKQDDGSLSTEDLVAIPDLSCGALCEYCSKFEMISSKIFMQQPKSISYKTNSLLTWLAYQDNSLKKIICIIDHNMTIKIAKIHLEDHIISQPYF